MRSGWAGLRAVVVAGGLWWSALAGVEAGDRWILPTANRALFAGDYPNYFMHVPRNWDGRAYSVWQGGQHGFVRSPVASQGEVLYMKFHEGLDIRPTRRDSRGNPLDVVWSVGPGKVAYVNSVTALSSYGKYVVVEHACEDGLYYSLYAHLARTQVETGQSVQAGMALGVMGYTGPGLDRARAHCHFEFDLLLSSRFDVWNGSPGGKGNPHGNFNGRNLAGIPVADYFLAGRSQPGLTVSAFLRGREPHHKVIVPKDGSRMEILRRYQWLRANRSTEGSAWEIAFDASGLPLAVASVTPDLPLSQPQVTWVRDSPHSQAYHTRRRLTNSGKHLSAAGLQYVNLVSGRF